MLIVSVKSWNEKPEKAEHEKEIFDTSFFFPAMHCLDRKDGLADFAKKSTTVKILYTVF